MQSYIQYGQYQLDSIADGLLCVQNLFKVLFAHW